MFKETGVNKLVEYIQILPQNEQKLIAQKIGVKKSKRKIVPAKKAKNNMQEFIAYTEKLPARLPKNYKFNRDEANER